MSVGVYKIPDITYELLWKLLKELRCSRKVVITIKNHSQHSFCEKPKVYFESGSSREGIPVDPVLSGEGLVWRARKTSYSTKGTRGLIVYYIAGLKKSLVFMWSIPYAYVFGHRNWWNIKVYDGVVEPCHELFKAMRDGRIPGNSSSHGGDLPGGLSYVGSMGNAGQSIVKVNIKDTSYDIKKE
ncbi:7730_t:CDS:2 [Paraglomus occultum]|uniref:7730_t:CDS:1 n=1 Tax=Paraglomus occultum TaxID=144539 RepID=A0A9N9B898_9GLOM|nr:7730_t:CDS:2 [Paraglomus occultum]